MRRARIAFWIMLAAYCTLAVMKVWAHCVKTTTVAPTLVCVGTSNTLTETGYDCDQVQFTNVTVQANPVAGIFTNCPSCGPCEAMTNCAVWTVVGVSITTPGGAWKLCVGETNNFAAIGLPLGGSYQWTPGGTTPTASSTASAFSGPGSNVVAVSYTYDGLTCETTTTGLVVGVASVTSSSATVCVGGTLSFTATPDPVWATFPNAQPVWSLSPTNAGALTPTTGSNVTFSATNSAFGGAVQITAKCGTSIAQTTFTVLTNLWSAWSVLTPPTITATATAPASVCLGDPVTVTASVTPHAGQRTRSDLNGCASNQVSALVLTNLATMWVVSSATSTNGVGTVATYQPTSPGTNTVTFTVTGDTADPAGTYATNTAINTISYHVVVVPAVSTTCVGITNTFTAYGQPPGLASYTWSPTGIAGTAPGGAFSTNAVPFSTAGLSQTVAVTYGPCTAVSTVNVQEVKISLAGLNDTTQVNPGAWIYVNMDDDNANGTNDVRDANIAVAGENDLLAVTLSVLGAETNTPVTLAVSSSFQAGRVKVWGSAQRGPNPPLLDNANIILSTNFFAGQLATNFVLYAEGISISATNADVVFTLATSSCTDSAKVTVANIDLDADNDRDGSVTDLDLDDIGEETWTKTNGAIYNVNFDRDGTNTVSGANMPDAVHFGDNGTIAWEDWVLNHHADLPDITPFVIRQVGPLPPGSQVFLKLADASQVSAVHVFKRIAVGEQALWGATGGYTVPGGVETGTQLDITTYVDRTSTNYLSGDATFGLEGLKFRNTGTPYTFGGYLDFTLELRDAGGAVLRSDTVKLKVAPWLMLSHVEPSLQVWMLDARAPGGLDVWNPEFLAGFAGSGQRQTVVGVWSPANETFGQEAVSQWFQDHVEIGYYQRPGGPLTHCVFRLPYQRGAAAQPGWPLTRLLDPDVAVFQLQRSFGNGSGDYGGNLEIMPAPNTNSFGRIIIGELRSGQISAFLTSQEVQDPVTNLPTKWLDVGHVDEIFAFTSQTNNVVVADPADAFSLLTAIPTNDWGKSVFFATGGLPDAGTVTMAVPQANRIRTSADHRGGGWRYVRVYSGAAAGQIGMISVIKANYIEVSNVWTTTSKIIPGSGAATNYMQFVTHPAPTSTVWSPKPQQQDKYVLIQGTREWASGTPAAVTVAEVMADADFFALNATDIQGIIDTQVKPALNAAAGITLTYVKVPALYLGSRSGISTNRSAFAFNPGLANLQVVGNNLYFPRQFGPRNALGQDIFETTTASRLPASLFVDDWDLYHALFGEVHCGTATKRQFPSPAWWFKLP